MTVPIGTIMAYGGLVDGNSQGALARQGWLVCNGEALGRDDYPELFDVLGGSFGDGDNVRTFNLPDLRGRFLRGVDDKTGRDPDAGSRTASANGGNTGDKVGSLQGDEYKGHSHPFRTPPWYWHEADHNGNTFISAAKTQDNVAGGQHNDNTGARGGNETRPKNIYVNWIIKAKNV